MNLKLLKGRRIFTLTKTEEARMRQVMDDLNSLAAMSLEGAKTASDAISKVLEGVTASQAEPTVMK